MNKICSTIASLCLEVQALVLQREILLFLVSLFRCFAVSRFAVFFFQSIVDQSGLRHIQLLDIISEIKCFA